MIKLSHYRFQPKLIITLLFLFIFATFIKLGFWQLSRAAEKNAINQLAQEALQSDVVALERLDINNALFKPVSLVGSFDFKRQFLLDNKVYKGQAGYDVIVPFRLHTGGINILVNRGWVPLGSSRQQLPNVTMKVRGSVELAGVFSRPSKGFSSGPVAQISDHNWPRVVQYLDYSAMGDMLQASLLDGVIQARSGSVKLYAPRWSATIAGPEKHYGYAAQWFVMGAVLLLLYLKLNLKKLD